MSFEDYFETSPLVDEFDFHEEIGFDEGFWSTFAMNLIETDPEPFSKLIDCPLPESLYFNLEYPDENGVDRFDILILDSSASPEIDDDGDERFPVWAIIECKVSAAQTSDQLERYLEHESKNYVYIAPAPDWASDEWTKLSWRNFFTAYLDSTNPTASSAANHFLAYLDEVHPKVDGATIWSEIDFDQVDHFVDQKYQKVAARHINRLNSASRFEWIEDHTKCPSRRRASSSAGNSTLMTWNHKMSGKNYLHAELEARPSRFSWPKDTPRKLALTYMVSIDNISNSSEYPWDTFTAWTKSLSSDKIQKILTNTAPAPATLTTRTKTRSTREDSLQLLKKAHENGAPRWTGYGYGERQLKSGWMGLGIQFSISIDAKLQDIAETIDIIDDIMLSSIEGF